MRNRVKTTNIYVESRREYASTSAIGPQLLLQYETMEDELTVEFFTKRKRGELLPINPMSKVDDTILVSNAIGSYYRSGSPATIYNIGGPVMTHSSIEKIGGALRAGGINLSGISLPDFPDSGPLLLEALEKARSKQIDLLTFLKEIDKTFLLLWRAGKSILKRADRIKRGISRRDFPTGSQRLAEFNKRWLEYRYGWRLLAYDVIAFHDHVVTKLGDDYFDRVRGSSDKTNRIDSQTVISDSSVSICVNGSIYSNAFPFVRFDGTRTKSVVRRTRAGVGIKYDAGNTGFRLDPLVTLHEVIPFSFIVSWFLNTSEIVGRLSPFAKGGLEYAWITSTEEVSDALLLSPKSQYATGSSKAIFTTQPFVDQAIFKVTKSRELVDSLPFFPLSFSLDVNPLKVVDIIAIALGGYQRKLLRG